MAKPGDELPKNLMWRGSTIYVRVYSRGRERWVSSRGQSIPAAQELRDALKGDASRGKLHKAMGTSGPSPTLSALVDTYLDEWRDQTSFRDVERHAQTWKDSVLGSRRAEDLTPGDITKTLQDLTAKRSWKPASRNRCLAFLKTLLGKALRDDLIERNPCVKVKKKPEAPRERHLSQGEAARLHAVLQPEQWDIVCFAIWSGLRQGAQLRARVADVDLEKGTLKVEELAGKKKTPRVVPLVGEGLAAVGRLVSRAKALGSPWLFPGRNPKQPLSAKGAHQMLARACEKAEVLDFTWHDLRHTCGSWLTQAGVPSLIVQEVLGHRTAAMTRRYVQTEIGHRREALSRIASFFPAPQENTNTHQANAQSVAKTVAPPFGRSANPDEKEFSRN